MKADAYRSHGFWCLRILRFQFDVTDHRKKPPLWSERYPDHAKGAGFQGHRVHVGPYCFRWGMLNRMPDYGR